MKVSLRAKLVLLVTIVATLPLLAAVLIIVLGGRTLRSESIARGIQSVALAESSSLRTALVKDIEKLQFVFNETMVREVLGRSDKVMNPIELEELDQAWPTLPAGDRRVTEVLNNAVAVELRRAQTRDPRLVEILLTDRFGQLVAATGRTTDYYQADEDWWLGADNDGDSRLFIPAINYDRSSGVWSVDLCVPVVQDGQLLGVGKAVLDISRWLRSTSISVGEVDAALMLVRGDGTIVFRPGVEPLSSSVQDWSDLNARAGLPGWRITHDGEIQAFVRIRLPGQIGDMQVQAPDWTVVIFLPRSEALQPVTELSIVVGLVGLAIIVVMFLVGLLLADHVVVSRIYRLHAATRKVAEGDLSHRVAPRRSSWRQVALDEIDELADDFNFMVDQIKRGYENLAASDQLKMKFIRIAGHELRTPVSYILGTARLLKDSSDPTRLLHALQAIGSKAKRLDEIIQAMFKLMPERRYSEDVHYVTVSVSELLEEVYLDCFPFIEQRKQQLIIEGADRIESLQADRNKLRDILENLVMNAIKFTPDGGVVKIRVGHQLGGFGTFAVQDQGPGIPEADMPHIFEPFYSGGDVMKHSSGSVGYEKRGMGLGLAIVRHFAELHGGSVSAASGPTGTIFTVTVPLEPPARRHVPEENPPATEQAELEDQNDR